MSEYKHEYHMHSYCITHPAALDIRKNIVTARFVNVGLTDLKLSTGIMANATDGVTIL